MQFKNPEILYALLLLAIPIIIHLFQLRRFQKVEFTNVAFLKEVTLQTRKSSVIKKWLTLITRLLLLAAIIFAFAQPYYTNKKSYNSKQETVIYLDNSYSLQAKGNNGTLLQEAINDLLTNLEYTQPFTLVTNNQVLKNTTVNAVKNELLKIKPTNHQLNYNTALLQAKKQFTTNPNSLKNLIFISDFQQKADDLNISEFVSSNTYIVKLQPEHTNNISIDSIYISKSTPENLEATVVLKNHGETVTDLPISLFNDDVLLTKLAVNITDKSSAVFTIPNNTVINGKLSLNDTQLQFDNTFYFNINKPSEINVLSINETDDSFLKKIFNEDEFNYQSTLFNQINYNNLDTQNLIILNELKSIPVSLSTTLIDLKNKGIHILIIPSNKAKLNTYNQFFNNFSNLKLSSKIEQEKYITKINFSHPIYKGVFSNQITNFQYPKVNSFYSTIYNTSSVLSFENNTPFLINLDNVYVFLAALNDTNSNFKNSPLVVPTLYNIGKQSLELPKLYYTIGNENKIDVKTTLGQDEILTLAKSDIKLIPQQQSFSNKVSIITNDLPDIAGIYNVLNNDEIIENISYNYNRNESDLRYIDASILSQLNVSNSIKQVINNIKSSTKVNELWKWFVIFGLFMLFIEMLILKYYK